MNLLILNGFNLELRLILTDLFSGQLWWLYSPRDGAVAAQRIVAP